MNPGNKKQNKDPFYVLKHIAYCRSQPPSKLENPALSDLIRFAKFQLCQERKILYLDPVWDRYTDEQVLIEYWACLFDKDKTFREEFEAGQMGDAVDEFLEWTDKQMGKTPKNKESKKEKALKELEDTIEEDFGGFEDTPESLRKAEDVTED